MKTLPGAIIAGKGGDSERVLPVRVIPEFDISHNLNNDRMRLKFVEIPDLLP